MSGIKQNPRPGRIAAILAAVLLTASIPVSAQDAAPAAAPEIVVHVAFGADVDRAARELIGQSDEFAVADFAAETGQVYCLTRIMNLDPSSTVTHAWYYEGKTMARVELTVGSADWRTWSSKRILPAWTGSWEVKVLDADDMVLGSAGFVIE